MNLPALDLFGSVDCYLKKEIMPKVVVNIHLKPEILDPQGKAVFGALVRQGLTELIDVRQGKQFILTLSDKVTPDLLKNIEFLAQNLLSNPVIEDFTIEVKNES